jgi:hypothetical protein
MGSAHTMLNSYFRRGLVGGFTFSVLAFSRMHHSWFSRELSLYTYAGIGGVKSHGLWLERAGEGW